VLTKLLVLVVGVEDCVVVERRSLAKHFYAFDEANSTC
jgi:hypothetical protein